jgi:hypothetical protein
MKTYDNIGLGIPEFLLPAPGLDYNCWAVIACDQFTSEPEYWKKVSEIVGDAPSTLHLTLPEVYLGKPEETQRLQTINSNMEKYLSDGIFQSLTGMVYIERLVAGRSRRGLLVCLDLEKYDFNKGSTSLIRATEGTILDRLPPRIKIRENASLEFPHILVLIDDPMDIVIGTAAKHKSDLQKLYDFDLMLGSGHLSGWLINQNDLETRIINGLQSLADLEGYRVKYLLPQANDVLLYAMGDGNHSLATAKAIWEQTKARVGMQHPSRYALVELENVHDTALEFEPIHRVLFNVRPGLVDQLLSFFGNRVVKMPVESITEMKELVRQSTNTNQRFGFLDEAGISVFELVRPRLNLPVGNLQSFLDDFIKNGGASSIDYVHGEEAVINLGRKAGNAGFFLPAMHKTELFKTVILDGALPRKTFSMGEAIEKRFYLESRKIK